MKKLLTVLLINCLLTPAYLSAQTADETAVAEKVELLRKLLITPDKAALENLVTDDLSYGHSIGVIENKDLFVNGLLEGRMAFKDISLTDQSVHLSGNVAIVRHRFTGSPQNSAIPKIDIIVLMVWQNKTDNGNCLPGRAQKFRCYNQADQPRFLKCE